MSTFKKLLIFAVLGAIIGISGPTWADDEDGDLNTDLTELPEVVLAAAEGAKDGITITGFKSETEMGQLIYEVQGTADEMCYEIEVTENGQVLEIEDCD